jgi:protein-S-isoprenylcysteine O-methyltransferase Ste14
VVVRRASVETVLGDAPRRRLTGDAARFEERLEGPRARIRDCYDLVATAATAEQVTLAQQAREAARIAHERTRRFQDAAAAVALVAVVPGLVAAYYGAQVKGVPGQGAESGWYVLLGVLASSVVLAVGLFLALRARTNAPDGHADE